MPGTMEYIESYFQQTLNSEERAAFEARCERDEEFAKDVAFYITARQAIREELLGQKVNEWKKDTRLQCSNGNYIVRWFSYARFCARNNDTHFSSCIAEKSK